MQCQGEVGGPLGSGRHGLGEQRGGLATAGRPDAVAVVAQLPIEVPVLLPGELRVDGLRAVAVGSHDVVRAGSPLTGPINKQTNFNAGTYLFRIALEPWFMVYWIRTNNC